MVYKCQRSRKSNLATEPQPTLDRRYGHEAWVCAVGITAILSTCGMATIRCYALQGITAIMCTSGLCEVKVANARVS